MRKSLLPCSGLSPTSTFPLVCDFLFPDVRYRRNGRNAWEAAAPWMSSRRASCTMPSMSIVRQNHRRTHRKRTGAPGPGQTYLFVSNHRDIMLDAAFLQSSALRCRPQTSEITFGANLMQGQLVIDLGRSNKMFRIERPTTVTSPRDFLIKSSYVSEYIRYAISSKEGRAYGLPSATDVQRTEWTPRTRASSRCSALSGGEDRVKPWRS